MDSQNQAEKIDIYNMGGDNEGHACGVPMPVVVISPELPENIKEQLMKALHMVGHEIGERGEASPNYVLMARNGDIHLLNMLGAPSRNEMAKFAAQHANQNDVVAIIAVAEGWSLPVEVQDQLMKDHPDGPPEDFKISEHPAAYEALNVQIETIKGVWVGTVELSKYLKDSTEARSYKGDLKLDKIDLSAGDRYNYPPSLVWNIMIAMEASNAPEVFKVLSRAILGKRIETKKAEWAEADKAKADAASADKADDPQ